MSSNSSEWAIFLVESFYDFFHELTTGSDKSIYIFRLISWKSNKQNLSVIENDFNNIPKIFFYYLESLIINKRNS